MLMTNPNFVIICGSRTGSNMLGSAIGSHSQINWLAEVMIFRKITNSNCSTPEEYLDTYFQGSGTGVKIAYRNLDYFEDFDQYFHRNNLRVVHLVRCPLQVATSYLLASYHNAWKNQSYTDHIELSVQDVLYLAKLYKLRCDHVSYTNCQIV